MGLLVRMLLYFLFGALAGYGFATFDGASGTVTIDVNGLATAIAGVLSFVATFLVGRIGARLKGWRT